MPFVMTFVGDVNIFHGRVYARPHEVELSRSDIPEVRQFMGGLADGPVAFHYPAADYSAELLDEAADAQ